MGSDQLAVGYHATFEGAPGIGRVVKLEKERATVDFFESVSEPSVGRVVVERDDLQALILENQTRVFFQDGARWHAGRIVADTVDREGKLAYYVRLPNSEQDVRVAASRLFVRWDRPPRDPLQIFLAGGNESPFYRDSRLPVRSLLVRDRASSASAAGISSSGVQMHPHQVAAAFRIIRDPVQRYLLADEVGMGKTIEAGFVIRQTLIDDPRRKVGIICPDALVAQWRSELRDKFFIGDFGRQVKVVSHSQPETWTALHGTDLVVVDEAHLLAKVDAPDEPTYSRLAAVSHSVERLLLLSATPFTQRSTTHLALLHLLDRDLYSWERIGQFESLLEKRKELAHAIYMLEDEPDPSNPEYLQYQLNTLKEKVPADALLQELIDTVMGTFKEPDGTEAKLLARRVASVRAHVSETYRLHHRVLRARRHNIAHERLDDLGVMTPFSFTGRSKPRFIRPPSSEVDATADLVEGWMAACSAYLLDNGLEAEPYGALAGLLVSRIGGPISDLTEILRYRVDGTAVAGLSREEREMADLPQVMPFEKTLLARFVVPDVDAVTSLAESIVAYAGPQERVLVFCGQGVFATALFDALRATVRGSKYALAHLHSQSEAEREESVQLWRDRGGALVVDHSGELGRNFQDANLIVHGRLPWSANVLEQRIGRVDRYGRAIAARGIVVGDSNHSGVLTAWMRLLDLGFGVFDRSISAEQEVVGGLCESAWVNVIRGGVEELELQESAVRAAIAQETRNINELDALESSWEVTEELGSLAERISMHDDQHALIERRFRSLITGSDGFRFDEKEWGGDGSIRFLQKERVEPLLSPRLAGRLMVPENSRTGGFDRWHVRPAKRLFRRGNPFIDAIEQVLELDDRGQASSVWRLDKAWRQPALLYFAFDFLVEADPAPLLAMLGGNRSQMSTAMRRCDWSLPPFEQRVWVATNSMSAVTDASSLEFLNDPYTKPRDTNLNPQRVGSLNNLVGAEFLGPVAIAALGVARTTLFETTALQEATAEASQRVASETEVLVARSRARSAAARMVADPESLVHEIALGRAVQAGVERPRVREVAVTCLVRSATGWESFA